MWEQRVEATWNYKPVRQLHGNLWKQTVVLSYTAFEMYALYICIPLWTVCEEMTTFNLWGFRILVIQKEVIELNLL